VMTDHARTIGNTMSESNSRATWSGKGIGCI
jgi:hypothetical protein